MKKAGIVLGILAISVLLVSGAYAGKKDTIKAMKKRWNQLNAACLEGHKSPEDLDTCLDQAVNDVLHVMKETLDQKKLALKNISAKKLAKKIRKGMDKIRKGFNKKAKKCFKKYKPPIVGGGIPLNDETKDYYQCLGKARKEMSKKKTSLLMETMENLD